MDSLESKVAMFYTGPFSGSPPQIKPASEGILNPMPYQFGYDFPREKKQVHFHGPDETTITDATIRDYQRRDCGHLSSYEAAMLALRCEEIKLKKLLPDIHDDVIKRLARMSVRDIK